MSCAAASDPSACVCMGEQSSGQNHALKTGRPGHQAAPSRAALRARKHRGSEPEARHRECWCSRASRRPPSGAMRRSERRAGQKMSTGPLRRHRATVLRTQEIGTSGQLAGASKLNAVSAAVRRRKRGHTAPFRAHNQGVDVTQRSSADAPPPPARAAGDGRAGRSARGLLYACQPLSRDGVSHCLASLPPPRPPIPPSMQIKPTKGECPGNGMGNELDPKFDQRVLRHNAGCPRGPSVGMGVRAPACAGIRARS